MEIEGQLNVAERRLITETIVGAAKKPLVAIEVGTWLGGGSTLHSLRALEQNGVDHLWGIEVDRAIHAVLTFRRIFSSNGNAKLQ